MGDLVLNKRVDELSIFEPLENVLIQSGNKKKDKIRIRV